MSKVEWKVFICTLMENSSSKSGNSTMNRASFKILYPLVILAFSLFAGCKKEGSPDNQSSPRPQPEGEYTTPATSELLIYEVNLRAFSDEGTLKGVEQRMEHFKKLGVNMLWLMPVHPIGVKKGINSPYSVRNYYAVADEYGSKADFRDLVQTAHNQDIGIMMDWVANHTAWDHPWIANKSWYTQDAQGNIVHPPGTDWQDVADLNYSNSTMRDSMQRAMLYWVGEMEIDGFRCDYADGVPYDFWLATLDTLSRVSDKDLVFLAEGDRSDHFQAGFDLSFGWSFYGSLLQVFDGSPASDLVKSHKNRYANVPAGRQVLRFTTNHDESAWDATPITHFNGKDGALAASAATCAIGGVPLIYSSQEVGRSATLPFFSNDPINWDANLDMLQQYRRLYSFYHSSDALQKGDLTDFSHDEVVFVSRKASNTEVLAMVNVRNSRENSNMPFAFRQTTWQNALSGDTVTLGNALELDPYEYLFLKRTF